MHINQFLTFAVTYATREITVFVTLQQHMNKHFQEQK